jgi:uncharacterized protein (DUF1810 family)
VPEIDLSRFVSAHAGNFERALNEIEGGRKVTHWMWYIFPQVAGLGVSAMSQRYAIQSMHEAEAFLVHPDLGVNYRRAVDAARHQVIEQNVTITELFGSPDDAKLVSSLTLFSGVARHVDPTQVAITICATQADEILQAAFSQGFAPCTITERFLSR